MQTLSDQVLFSFDKVEDYVSRRHVGFLRSYKWLSLLVYGKGWLVFGKKKGMWYEKDTVLRFLERQWAPRYEIVMKDLVMEAGGCWLWNGIRNEDGYPQVPCGFRHKHSFQTQSAHYFFFDLIFGHRPERIHMKCMNGNCLRPSHMQEGHYGECSEV